MEWYYEKNGAQSGPVTEAVLNELVASGEMSSQNLVWQEGMADWSPYETVFSTAMAEDKCPTCDASVSVDQLIPAGDRQVCPNCRDSYAQGLREGVTSTAALSGGLGTGGMTPNAELRGMGKEALAGRWGMSVVITLIYTVLQQVSAIIPVIGSLIQWVIMGPLSVGYHRSFLGIYRGETVETNVLFSGFSQFWRGFGIYFMVTLIVSLAALAAAIPGGILAIAIYASEINGSGAFEENPLFILGIVLAAVPGGIVAYYMYLRYAMVYFIASDHPELGVFQVLEAGKEMMYGHKKKLFWFYLSYIPWLFVGALALLVGLLWSITYLYAGLAAFYDDLADEA